MNSFYIPSDMLYLIGLYSEKDYRLISRKCDEKYIEVMKSRRIIVKCNDEEFNSMEWLRYMSEITLMSCTKIMLDNTMEIISGFINLTVFKISYSTYITDMGIKYISSMNSLNYLSLNRVKSITNLSLEYISNMDNLEHLSIQKLDRITDEGFIHIMNMKSLEKLQIYDNDRLCGEFIEYISQIVILKHLEINIFYEKYEEYIPYISKLDNLYGLSLLTEREINLSYTILKHCNIRKLHVTLLYKNQLNEICQYAELVYLKLSMCMYLTSEWLLNILSLKNLEKLFIGDLGSDIDISIIEKICQLSHIKIFTLRRIRITGNISEFLEFSEKDINILYHSPDTKFIID